MFKCTQKYPIYVCIHMNMCILLNSCIYYIMLMVKTQTSHAYIMIRKIAFQKVWFSDTATFPWDQIQFIKKAFKHYKYTNAPYVYSPTQRKLYPIPDDSKSSLFCTNEGDVLYKLTKLIFQIAMGKYDT